MVQYGRNGQGQNVHGQIIQGETSWGHKVYDNELLFKFRAQKGQQDLSQEQDSSPESALLITYKNLTLNFLLTPMPMPTRRVVQQLFLDFEETS